MRSEVTLSVPGAIYSECFDPLATDVPGESGWPEPRRVKAGFGYRYTYEVSRAVAQDMLDHAKDLGESWVGGGVEPETQKSGVRILRWVHDTTKALAVDRVEPKVPAKESAMEEPRPDINRGDQVLVTEENISPWTGEATAVKPSVKSGWYIEVRRNDDGMTWSIPSRHVVRQEGGFLADS